MMEALSPANIGLLLFGIFLLSRRADRPTGADYINALFSDFMEFHGDRFLRDDPAVMGGIAMFGNTPVTVIAQVKGKTTKENVQRNFGMMSPEGYRKTSFAPDSSFVVFRLSRIQDTWRIPLSMNTASDAPRLKASMPMAPLPANRSRKERP